MLGVEGHLYLLLTFLYDFAIGRFLANHSNQAIQTVHHKHNGSLVQCLAIEIPITQYSKVANADNLYMYRRKEIVIHAYYGYNFQITCSLLEMLNAQSIHNLHTLIIINITRLTIIYVYKVN